MRNQVKHTKVLPPIGERLETAEKELKKQKDMARMFYGALETIAAMPEAQGRPAQFIYKLFESMEGR